MDPRTLPQLQGAPFLTDGGLETTLVFRDGLDFPLFAAFTLLRSATGREALARYFADYLALAERHGTGIVLESPTWRANPDWGERLGYTLDGLAEANRAAVALLTEVTAPFVAAGGTRVVSGCIGPRGDGYRADRLPSVDEARAYHDWQVGILAGTAADMVCAMTMTTAEEGTGVALAAQAHGLPVAISFTTETDGRLPSGQPLGEAIAQVDALTDGYPAYFMVNCAHPEHVQQALTPGAPWLHRLRGLRANATRLSHAELDAADRLDDGDPEQLAGLYVGLCARLGSLNVLGGCCGTDVRHVHAIATACTPLFRHLVR
ncbi:homocysteine S-methyltransferase family protein [Macromonas nakdongensis]|uniref:homocysteine S-methyltransferase family protein n=1 Tax=Macromonas nakdongensis TaxID=1843082 RepID=UPI000C32C21B|nr:homocysteine S-methyltransferase family protein [Macromonas nakdongensis]